MAHSAAEAVAEYHRHADRGWSPPWIPLLDPQQFSGHKLHVAADDLGQVRDAARRAFPVCQQAGLGLKVAGGPDTLARNDGKGLTIYLPRRATIDRDTSLIAAELAGYQPAKTTSIYGNTRLTDALHHRYEFFHDPGGDVYSRHEYHELYKPAEMAMRQLQAQAH